MHKTLCLPILLLAMNHVTAHPELVDPKANAQTVALYENLRAVAADHVLFGAQNTTAYGHGWVGKPGDGQSDVKAVTGSFPAVYGWDLQDLTQASHVEEQSYNLSQTNLVAWCKEAYERGGVITFAWHMENPVTGGSFYDLTPAAATMLPGGDNHQSYLQTLDRVADFFKELAPVPVIFRPFHEHNGDWFWWGKGFVTEEEYMQLWRMTVHYLRDEKGVHNLLYAFSPDRSRMDLSEGEEAYFYAYPGDAYVDILGIDNYWDVGHSANEASPKQNHADFVRSLEMVVQLATARDKIPALTETGMDTLPNPQWYTEVLLAGLNANATTRRIAYAQVWRNANKELEGRDHFYVPYPGHPAAEDFVKFKQSGLILFEDELPDLYRETKAGKEAKE
ncbi:MAG: glycosyl hydrolase [Verrucomicrobiota bacterium JB022]|nr:glycosyl hydrolase [Verrucomicrobiota bacterium JB022]